MAHRVSVSVNRVRYDNHSSFGNVAAMAVAFEGGLGLLALLLGWLLGVWPVPGMERTGGATARPRLG